MTILRTRLKTEYNTRRNLDLQGSHHVLAQGIYLDITAHHLESTRFYLGQIQYIGNQLQEQFIVLLHDTDILLLFRLILRVSQQIGEPDDSIQRGTNLVTHVREESRFQPIRLFRPIPCLNQFHLGFLQIRDIVIDAYHLNHTVLWTIIPHKHVHASPRVTAVFP